MSPDDLDERLSKADGSFIQQPFRFMVSEGKYEWKLARILRIPGAKNFEYMFSLQSFTASNLPVLNSFYDR